MSAPRVTREWRRRTDVKWYMKIIHFWFAPVVEDWVGWSLTRTMAVATMYITYDIGHHWIEAKMPLGWAFVGLIIGGISLAVIIALGAKYVSKCLDIGELWIRGKANPGTIPPMEQKEDHNA